MCGCSQADNGLACQKIVLQVLCLSIRQLPEANQYDYQIR